MVHPCDKSCGNKTASGYCATTACINPQYSNYGTAQYGQGVQKRIVTNADCIRSMSDEELATWLNTMQSNAWHSGRLQKTPNKYPSTNQTWLDWLRQEATDGAP